MSRYADIPKIQQRTKDTRFVWVERKRGYRGPVPSADRSVIFGPSWVCFRRDPALKGTVYAEYCGAPGGIRCDCGAQLAGHDPGDEDLRAP